MPTLRLISKQRRSVYCPTCDAAPGHACRSFRIPSAATFGGGWGGYSRLDREHPSRVAAARALLVNTPATPAL